MKIVTSSPFTSITHILNRPSWFLLVKTDAKPHGCSLSKLLSFIPLNREIYQSCHKDNPAMSENK